MWIYDPFCGVYRDSKDIQNGIFIGNGLNSSQQDLIAVMSNAIEQGNITLFEKGVSSTLMALESMS